MLWMIRSSMLHHGSVISGAYWRQYSLSLQIKGQWMLAITYFVRICQHYITVKPHFEVFLPPFPFSSVPHPLVSAGPSLGCDSQSLALQSCNKPDSLLKTKEERIGDGGRDIYDGKKSQVKSHTCSLPEAPPPPFDPPAIPPHFAVLSFA